MENVSDILKKDLCGEMVVLINELLIVLNSTFYKMIQYSAKKCSTIIVTLSSL